MLLFAVFTLGYFFGVFITLKLFGQKDRVDGVESQDFTDYSGSDRALSSREIFTQLTKINYPTRSQRINITPSTRAGFLAPFETKEVEDGTYATS